MNQAEFQLKSVEIKTEWRAVCHSNGKHWKGTWKNSYTEAFQEAELHRVGNYGKNKRHEVMIMSRTYSEALIS